MGMEISKLEAHSSDDDDDSGDDSRPSSSPSHDKASKPFKLNIKNIFAGKGGGIKQQQDPQQQLVPGLPTGRKKKGSGGGGKGKVKGPTLYIHLGPRRGDRDKRVEVTRNLNLGFKRGRMLTPTPSRLVICFSTPLAPPEPDDCTSVEDEKARGLGHVGARAHELASWKAYVRSASTRDVSIPRAFSGSSFRSSAASPSLTGRSGSVAGGSSGARREGSVSGSSARFFYEDQGSAQARFSRSSSSLVAAAGDVTSPDKCRAEFTESGRGADQDPEAMAAAAAEAEAEVVSGHGGPAAQLVCPLSQVDFTEGVFWYLVFPMFDACVLVSPTLCALPVDNVQQVHLAVGGRTWTLSWEKSAVVDSYVSFCKRLHDCEEANLRATRMLCTLTG